jgi:steroid delta-isomerase
MTERAIRETIEHYWAAFSAGDRAAWLALYAEDATVEDPVGSDVRVGHDGIGAFWDETRGLADSIELRSLGIVNVCGDEVAFAMEVRPTTGGMTFTMTAIDVMRFNDAGRIQTMRAFWQPESMRPAD